MICKGSFFLEIYRAILIQSFKCDSNCGQCPLDIHYGLPGGPRENYILKIILEFYFSRALKIHKGPREN